LIKKLNTSNRNIHINRYRSYLIYSYLNNYNLKLFFFFLSKKYAYCKNIKLVVNSFRKLKLVSLGFKNNLFVEKNLNVHNSLKDKYFTPKPNEPKNSINQDIGTNQGINIMFRISNNKALSNTLYKKKSFLINKSLNSLSLISIYKEITIFIFILGLIKQYEYYKILTLLFFINIAK